jgi:hypothetical protein
MDGGNSYNYFSEGHSTKSESLQAEIIRNGSSVKAEYMMMF